MSWVPRHVPRYSLSVGSWLKARAHPTRIALKNSIPRTAQIRKGGNSRVYWESQESMTWWLEKYHSCYYLGVSIRGPNDVWGGREALLLSPRLWSELGQEGYRTRGKKKNELRKIRQALGLASYHSLLSHLCVGKKEVCKNFDTVNKLA